jgi:hypothetical protein
MSGQGDAALSWEGLRAQWKGQGLDFDYWLGRDFSKLPANSFVIRKSDFEDASKKDLYERYFRGWAMGLEFGRQNPRAATQIVMEQFPALGSQMTPDVAVESQMQLAAVFAGRWEERQKKWGYHLAESWQQFFDVGREIGQIQGDFKLEDVYCDVAYKDVTALFFIVSAGWCTPCTLYAQRLLTQYAAIERAGGLIAIVEAQTTDFAPADNDFAQRHLSRIIGDAYAIRIGSHDSQPVADFLHTQDIVQSFPTTIAVRTRDMRIITDSNRSQYYLPLAQIAADPEADWSNPSAPPFVNNCGEGDEELTEPNDSPRQAAPLEPGTLGGGICTTDGDFYAISLEGPWSLSVEFDSTLGDIDVYV